MTACELAQLAPDVSGWALPAAWHRVRAHSLGWVVARDPVERLVGFVNVAGDGGVHAFLLDTAVAPEHRHRGVAGALVDRAVTGARDAGCDWLHVDFAEPLAALYLEACGFTATTAGLLRLR